MAKFRPDKEWTTDMRVILIRMWKDGTSAAQIALVLGVSRSSVMGKVYRMRESGVLEYRQNPAGWGRRPKQADKDAVIHKAKAERPAQQAGQTAAIRKVEEPPPIPVVAPPVPAYDPNKRYRNILQLNHNTCRYIMTEDVSPSAFYCGEEVHRRAYCKAHAELCYSKQMAPIKKKDRHASKSLVFFPKII